MKFRRLYLPFLLLLVFQQASAQQDLFGLSNLRYKTFPVRDSILMLDSTSLVPGSVMVMNIPDSYYRVNEAEAILRWKHIPVVDTVRIRYRVLPYKINQVYRGYNYDSIRNNFLMEKKIAISPQKKAANTILDFGNINYNGSMGRGISFGNAQDAVVNSSLNLQLNGIVGDSLEISAAITDNNIPIQPDGNTQNLSDFDRVYIQVGKRNWKAAFGDIDIRQNNNYFLNFYKRLQGGMYTAEKKWENGISNNVLASASVAKGKFNRQVLQPTEGNQGPYRLKGANNELYFTVLAGTERVFIDGQLMQRGEDQDYVINYNTAELTFMPKQMITKDKRIQVEFEYADRNFLNSTLYLNNTTVFNKRLSVSVGLYSNQDSRNTSINQSLTANQKQFLSGVGDKIDSTFFFDAVVDSFTTNKILYKRVDTVYNVNIHDSVFVHSTNPNDTLYAVSFTYLGPGKGNYVQEYSTTNGKVLKWVAPDANNIKQGDWETITQLVTPKKQQVANVTVDYRLSNKYTLKTDLAFSKYDLNLFSSKDKSNDNGVAAKFELTGKRSKIKLLGKSLEWESSIGYEYVQNTFKPLERLRRVEFNRDWNLDFNVQAADEHITNASVLISDNKNNRLKYEVKNYTRSDRYSGWQQTLSHVQKIWNWNLNQTISLTNTETPTLKGFYLRPTVDINKLFTHIKNVRLGLKYSGEYNPVKIKQTSLLNATSFAFTIWEAYIRSDEQKLNKWGVSYFTREDRLPQYDKLTRVDRSNNIGFSTELMSNEKHQLKLNATYRKLDVMQPLVSKQKAEESILSRAEYYVNEWNGLLTGNVLYELGAGQEPKREFTFIEVPAGQGEYAWIDYNGNGIAELNEFEIALFPDQRKFIRINTPTNAYVKANYIQFNYHADINPKAVIASHTKNRLIVKMLSKLNLSSTLQISKKDISNGSFLFNPFSKTLEDSSLLSTGSFLSNTLFVNRSGSKWGLDVTHTLNRNKSLLTYGFESKDIRNLMLRTRLNIGRSIVTNLTMKTGSNILNTPSFGNRNYSIDENNIEPSVSYIYATKFRAVLSYAFTQKNNAIGYKEKAAMHTVNSEVKYNVFSSGMLQAKFTITNIAFSYLPGGDANSTTGYVLLDGLLPGKNFLWNAEYTKRLKNNLEISFQYDGRKAGESKVVHIGRASLRAIL